MEKHRGRNIKSSSDEVRVELMEQNKLVACKKVSEGV
jgi:hypothetical protein